MTILNQQKWNIDGDEGMINPLFLKPKVDGETRFVVLSDIHLGNQRVKSPKIISTLDKILCKDRLANVDFVIITGDLFDKRLSLDSEDAFHILPWIKRFLRTCAETNTVAIVLAGTPSHDNNQSRWLPEINLLSKIDADVRYYDNLHIEPLFENGPIALYIRDELNHDADKTWMQVNELMRNKDVKSVDFAFMHGMFTYQEPIRTVVSHREDRYESIVNHRIVIGHHHTHTTCGKIVVPGSLERLRHNEEESKGHYQFSLINGIVCDEYFITNDDATVFTTIDAGDKTINEMVREIKSYNYPKGSHVRLRLSRQDPLYHGIKDLANKFPLYHITTKLVETESFATDSTELIDRPQIVAIRPDTIKDLLIPRLAHLPPDLMTIAVKIIEED